MTTNIEIVAGASGLVDRSTQQREAQRHALLVAEEEKNIKTRYRAERQRQLRAAPKVADEDIEGKRRKRKQADEPAATRRDPMELTLLPAYPPIAHPSRPYEKVYLFDGTLRKGAPGDDVAEQRFGLSVGTDYDDYEYERGTYQRVTRLTGVGPGGAPVLDCVLNYEADALTGSTGYVGEPPDDGLAVLDVYNPDSVSQYQSDVLEEYDDTEETIFAWVGYPGIGYGSWLVRNSKGQTTSPPYIVRNGSNSGTSISGSVIYFPKEDETEPPERAYLGSGTKKFSMYVRVLSGPPLQIGISFGSVYLQISHSHWLGNEQLGSRLVYLGGDRLDIPLTVTTDEMTDWTRISLWLSNRSYNLLVGSQTPQVGFVDEQENWTYYSFFLEAIQLRQVMWEGVDFGDYKSQVQISSVQLKKG